ncbi:MAG: hypothetical protein NTY19_37290 [Planctomycetota bacterium]|nr:hypothetical protein [Planctomycetota bacterium]
MSFRQILLRTVWLYAVYDFFRRQAGTEYFWDGDVIPKRDTIDFAGLDVIEKPRFAYRGLRYFAHRGLHRFQAEHWDLEGWQREIDWCVKKRFNLFMLRTGIDDLFQRAFPGEVPYPPIDAKDPDGVDRSYDDRTSFWALKYRGELRKQVLQYARDRGLLHPEDTGTITHWYLGANSWQPCELELPAAVARYCRTRYAPELAVRMEPLWNDFLAASQLLHWFDNRGEAQVWFDEPQYRLLATSAFLNLAPERLPRLRADLARFCTGLTPAPEVLAGLAELAAPQGDNPLWRRDALDMARTIANRALVAAFLRAALEMESWRAGQANGAALRQRAELTRRLMDTLADVLALSDDFSMHASLLRLERAPPLNQVAPTINPHSERTLKSNAENSYCRSQHYELVRHVYRPELDAFWEWVLGKIESGDKSPWKRPAEFSSRAKQIADKFYETPLAEMASKPPRESAALAAALTRLEGSVKELLDGAATSH